MVPLLGMAQDDLYFTSSKKAKEETQKRNQEKLEKMKATTTIVTSPAVVEYGSNTRSDDEYNRRYVYGGEYQNAGGAYMDDSLAARIDTVDGYYADSEYDMDDPELDYRFSRRIVRFHNPRLYALASPYYWDLYYGYGAWDYLYDPYDPWYWHYGWSYGWTWGPWDCWYGGIWGWHHPYAWTYWGWGPGWSRPVYYGNYHRNIVPREFNSSRGQMAAGNRIRTNAFDGRTLGSRTSALGSRTTVMNGRTSAVGTRTSAQDVTGRRGTSYTDYTNARTGRSSAAAQGAQTQVYNRTREGANQRSTITRGNVNGVTRSYSNQNSSSRTNTTTRTQTQTQTRTQTQTQTRTQTQTPTYSTPSRGSSVSSGSFGGGVSRGGGSFGGGGASRGGGGGGGGRR